MFFTSTSWCSRRPGGSQEVLMSLCVCAPRLPAPLLPDILVKVCARRRSSSTPPLSTTTTTTTRRNAFWQRVTFSLVPCCGIVTVWGLNTGRQRRTLVWLDIDFSKFMSDSHGPVGTQDGWSCRKSRDNLAAERRICKCMFVAAVCVLLVPVSNINMLRLKNVVCVWPYFKKSLV